MLNRNTSEINKQNRIMIPKCEFKIQNYTFKEGMSYTFKYDIIEGEEIIFVYLEESNNHVLLLSTYEYQKMLTNFHTKASLRSDKINQLLVSNISN